MAAKKKDHPCIKQVDKVLATRGEQLTYALSLVGAPRRIFVSTEKVEGKARPAMLAATYCPFCGKKMPSDEKEKG